MSTFNPLVPTGLLQLDVDYKNIQLNFNQLNNTYATDHVALTENSGLLPAGSGGAHKVVHMTAFSTVVSNAPNNQPVVAPAAVGNMGEVFVAQINDGVSTDEALYYKSGGGRLTQLTRNFQPVSSTNGYTFLPGGLILQWGQITSTASTFTTLLFATANINFPANCFAVFTQPYGSGTPPGDNGNVEIRKSTLSNTQFDWCFVTSSGQYTGFFWWALGN